MKKFSSNHRSSTSPPQQKCLNLAEDPTGKLDIAHCYTYWLKDAAERGMKHIYWDGCMFSNDIIESPETWQNILEAMIKVDQAL